MMQTELELANLRAETFERQYRQACQDHATAMAEVKRLRADLAAAQALLNRELESNSKRDCPETA